MERVRQSGIPNISYTIDHDICTGCGICQDACPSATIKIGVEGGVFRPVIDRKRCNNDKGCHRCYDVCPGLGVDLLGIANNEFVGDDIRQDRMAGRYLQCYTGHSSDHDIRWHSASGGMVSQFLIWLLERGEIDGAVVTKYDNSKPLMVKTFVATSKEDVLDARSSKYGPVTMAGMGRAIKEAAGNRYVIVGVPCHIQGFRKLMAVDNLLKKKIVGLFSIYCSSGRSFYLTEHVMKERGIKREDLRYFAYRDEGCLGSMVAVTNNSTVRCSYQDYYHPLRSIFVPRRCLFCIDHYGELADVCFGDIHVKPYSDDKVGVNSVIVRSSKWKYLLEECERNKAISLEPISYEIVAASQPMSFKKKNRNGAFINICKKIGMVVPDYNQYYLQQPTAHDVFDYIQNRIQQYIGRHRLLWPLIQILKMSKTAAE